MNNSTRIWVTQLPNKVENKTWYPSAQNPEDWTRLKNQQHLKSPMDLVAKNACYDP